MYEMLYIQKKKSLWRLKVINIIPVYQKGENEQMSRQIKKKKKTTKNKEQQQKNNSAQKEVTGHYLIES